MDIAYLNEFINAPREYVSLYESSIDALEAKYTFRPTVFQNDYHSHVVRGELTQNISKKMPEIVDELQAAFEDEYQVGDGYLSFQSFFDYRMDRRETMGKDFENCGKDSQSHVCGITSLYLSTLTEAYF